MDTNRNSANALHALFVVIERTACLYKVFAKATTILGTGCLVVY